MTGYIPTAWVNNSTPAISAANLGKIETELVNLHARGGFYVDDYAGTDDQKVAAARADAIAWVTNNSNFVPTIRFGPRKYTLNNQITYFNGETWLGHSFNEREYTAPSPTGNWGQASTAIKLQPAGGTGLNPVGFFVPTAGDYTGLQVHAIVFEGSRTVSFFQTTIYPTVMAMAYFDHCGWNQFHHVLWATCSACTFSNIQLQGCWDTAFKLGGSDTFIGGTRWNYFDSQNTLFADGSAGVDGNGTPDGSGVGKPVIWLEGSAGNCVAWTLKDLYITPTYSSTAIRLDNVSDCVVDNVNLDSPLQYAGRSGRGGGITVTGNSTVSITNTRIVGTMTGAQATRDARSWTDEGAFGGYINVLGGSVSMNGVQFANAYGRNNNTRTDPTPANTPHIYIGSGARQVLGSNLLVEPTDGSTMRNLKIGGAAGFAAKIRNGTGTDAGGGTIGGQPWVGTSGTW